MQYNFCTYFDNNYLIYGITLFRSLKKTGLPFHLYVACLDDQVYENLIRLALPEIIPLRLSEIESYDQEFAATKKTRSIVEYYFTMSPILPLYIFATFKDVRTLAYLDSDLYFFTSPESVFLEAGTENTLIFAHDFPPELKSEAEAYGCYNVAFQIYQNTQEGKECLEWWRKKCIEWCYDRVEKERFADQKYLDQWPRIFKNVVVANQSRSISIAPWNWSLHCLEIEDKLLISNGRPVCFYHFQDFKFINRWLVIPGNMKYLAGMKKKISNFIYQTYYRELIQTSAFLKAKIGVKNFNFIFKLKRYQKELRKEETKLIQISKKIKKGLCKLCKNEILFTGRRFF